MGATEPERGHPFDVYSGTGEFKYRGNTDILCLAIIFTDTSIKPVLNSAYCVQIK